MKKIQFLLFTILAFASCQKQYTYVERVRETSIFGGSSEKDKEEKVIVAASDTAAYLEAFKEFCISKKVYQDMLVKSMKDVDVPLDFKLYNEQGINISDIMFPSRADKEKEISERIFGMENIVGSSDKSGNGLGDWEIGHYVDEFQEETEEKYIKQSALGTFSNSATTNSDLVAHILVDKNDIRLRLQEYGRSYAKDDESIRFRIKSGDSLVTELRMWVNRDGYVEFLSYNKKMQDSLKNILLRGGEVKFSGVIDHYGKSTYHFTFNADKFQNALKELDKKNDETK